MSNGLLRSQSFVTSSGNSKKLLPANARRRALLISAPSSGTDNNLSNLSTLQNADGTVTGVKLTQAGAVNKTNTVTQASAVLTAGATPTMALQVNDGTSVYDLARGTLPLYWSGRVDLGFGSSVQWNVITAGAGATENLLIAGTQNSGAGRITLSFTGTAILDQGINLFFGAAPLLLLADLFGAALKEEINFISSGPNATVGVIEILDP